MNVPLGCLFKRRDAGNRLPRIRTKRDSTKQNPSFFKWNLACHDGIWENEHCFFWLDKGSIPKFLPFEQTFWTNTALCHWPCVLPSSRIVGILTCYPDKLLIDTVHGKTLSSVNSIMTLALPLLYTKTWNFLNTPETLEGRLSSWNITVYPWTDDAVWNRQLWKSKISVLSAF